MLHGSAPASTSAPLVSSSSQKKIVSPSIWLNTMTKGNLSRVSNCGLCAFGRGTKSDGHGRQGSHVDRRRAPRALTRVRQPASRLQSVSGSYNHRFSPRFTRHFVWNVQRRGKIVRIVTNVWSRERGIDYDIGRTLAPRLAALGSLEQIGGAAETAVYNGGSPWANYWTQTTVELRSDLVSSGKLNDALVDAFLGYCADPNWWTQTIAFTAVYARARRA
jgi:hypothetical protein